VKWITRERVKVDRVACPWLIRNFVDPQAEFLFVPVDQVDGVVHKTGAIPYDTSGAELGHHGEECSFDAVVKKYHKGRAVGRVAAIVRAPIEPTGSPIPGLRDCRRFQRTGLSVTTSLLRIHSTTPPMPNVSGE
jgi:hypothetical protein